MFRLSSLVPFFMCGLLLACQGDQNLPSDPGRALDLTAGGCKSEDFTSYTQALYAKASVERTRLQQCKTAEAAYSRGKLVQAEAAVNAILVAIYSDYEADALVDVSGDPSLEETVIEYMTIACSLGGLTPGSECLIPDAPTDLTDGSWVAAGPLATGNKGKLPNAQFGFRVDGGNGVYIFVSSRPNETLFLGDCPGSSANDCQTDVFDVDADGNFAGGITVESCEQFDTGRLRHMHCPEGEECEFGVPSPAPGQVVCSVASTGFMRMLDVATKPVQWVIHATPAYAAGLGTKFTQFSPVVIGDMDPRARGVVCTFIAQYNNGSEGTICELFEDAEATIPAECAPFDVEGNGEPCSCASVADEDDASKSSCPMGPKVPDSVVYTVKASKNQGGGTYNVFSEVSLAPDQPQRGGSNEVCFSLIPPNVTAVECPE